MKELSIEEKAKAYDKALKKARTARQNTESAVTIGILEEIFPELAESEDERIRKEILIYLDWLEGKRGCAPRGDYFIRDMIAWVEKQIQVNESQNFQHENKTCKENDDSLTCDDERIRKVLIELVKCNERSGYKLLNNVPTSSMLAWLEKQGEPIEINPSEFDLRLNKLLKQFESLPKEELISNLSYYLNVIQNDGTYKIEKQDEQKPIDYENANIPQRDFAPKVEPKFKVGDWINGYYTNYKVLSVNNKGYVVEDVDGNKINILFENEKFHHLWTIKDAKDGDVLYSPEYKLLWIYKNKEEYYAAINLNYANFTSFGADIEIPSDVCPATKEQRYLLFQKMEENSYSWNAEEKRLMYWGAEPSKLMGNPHTETIKKWSEEDERLIKISIACLSDFAAKGYENAVECIDWLKSLKGRVQPKQEWSEDDEVKINRIVACLENLNVADNDILLKDVDWLKSLKERIGG